MDAVRKLELLQEVETTATLIVKGNDGRLDEDSIQIHVRDCERIEEIGIKLEIVFKYPMSLICQYFETEYQAEGDDEWHYLGMKMFQ